MIKFLVLLFPIISFAGVKSIAHDIRKLKKMKKKYSLILARSIYKESKRYNIDPKILVSILKLESNFDQSAMNNYNCNDKECGDYSIAQINYKIWKKELNINLKKLKSSNKYAIHLMARILSKIRHKNDLWFLRYHSRNSLFQIRYLNMLEPILKKIGYSIPYKEKEKLLYIAVKRFGWKRVMSIFTTIPSQPRLVKYP